MRAKVLIPAAKDAAGRSAYAKPSKARPALPRSENGGFDAGNVREILERYGIPFIKSGVFDNVDAALLGAEDFEFPVVAKIVSRDISHRSDVGGVVMNIADLGQLREALAAIQSSVGRNLPNARIQGFEVQEQVVGGVEVFAGFLEAKPFAPLITIGTGGVLVELYKDVEYGLAPMKAAEFIGKLEKTRAGQLLGGFRGIYEKTSLAPLASLLENFSRLAIDSTGQIAAAELNPIIVRPGSGKVVVVDALLEQKTAN